MEAEGFYGANGGWSTYRVHEYLLMLQWLIENAAAADTAFLMRHAKLVVRSAWTADWERWFSTWENAHCFQDPEASAGRPWPVQRHRNFPPHPPHTHTVFFWFCCIPITSTKCKISLCFYVKGYSKKRKNYL